MSLTSEISGGNLLKKCKWVNMKGLGCKEKTTEDYCESHKNCMASFKLINDSGFECDSVSKVKVFARSKQYLESVLTKNKIDDLQKVTVLHPGGDIEDGIIFNDYIQITSSTINVNGETVSVPSDESKFYFCKESKPKKGKNCYTVSKISVLVKKECKKDSIVSISNHPEFEKMDLCESCFKKLSKKHKNIPSLNIIK